MNDLIEITDGVLLPRASITAVTRGPAYVRVEYTDNGDSCHLDLKPRDGQTMRELFYEIKARLQA